MKTLQFKKGSWHWNLAWRHGGWAYVHPDKQDFCAYVRCVIYGAMIMAAKGAGILYVLAAIGSWIGWATACVVQMQLIAIDEWYEMLSAGVVNLVILAVIFVALLWQLFNVFEYVTRKRRERAYQKEHEAELGLVSVEEPSFIRHAVESIKDKVCFKVEFK